MKSETSWFAFGIWSLFVFCFLSFGISAKTQEIQKNNWPDRFTAWFGFEIMADHNGIIIISAADSTSEAYKLGVRPGMEVLGWNTLPIMRKLESMKVRKYRKYWPLLTDQQIKLLLLPRGRFGETAEVFFMTPTGNNWGIRIKTEEDRRRQRF